MAGKVLRGLLSDTELGNAGTVSKTIRVPSRVAKGAIAVFADQTGTAFIDQSMDGSTWRSAAATNIVASTLLIVEATLVMPYARFRVLNGVTPQTVFESAYAVWEL